MSVEIGGVPSGTEAARQCNKGRPAAMPRGAGFTGLSW